MNPANILIAGCGDVGGLLAARLLAAGHQVTGLRRRVAALPAGVEALAADLAQPATLGALGGRNFDVVVVTTAAGRFDEPHYRAIYVDGLRHLLDALRGAPRVLLASSTGVYHQHDGQWVDEDSPAEPQGFAGRILLEAERLLGERTGGARRGGAFRRDLWSGTRAAAAGSHGRGRLPAGAGALHEPHPP